MAVSGIIENRLGHPFIQLSLVISIKTSSNKRLA